MDIDACIARLTGKDVKDACTFAQRITAESRDSGIWYPHFDQFAALLHHKTLLCGTGPSPSWRRCKAWTAQNDERDRPD